MTRDRLLQNHHLAFDPRWLLEQTDNRITELLPVRWPTLAANEETGPGRDSHSACKVCSGPLPEALPGRPRVFCSPPCALKGKALRRRAVPRTCEQCLEEFMARKEHVAAGMGRYCGTPCAALAATREGKFKGDKNPRWIGGVSNDNMRYKRRDIARHPERWAARAAVRSAVKSGRLVRLPCGRCGEPKTNGHHADYTRQLDVIWLCRQCHDAEHARLKASGCDPDEPTPIADAPEGAV